MKKAIKAAILDMDGVLTRTARVHSKAWKQLFDDFLQRQGAGHEPFDIDTDYPKYVDGIPRYDGIKRFLESRIISLPFGNENDEPGYGTVCALGNLKNEIFHDQLKKDGVETFKENIETIKSWKAQGISLAVISSSKNCKNVLDRAGLLDLFDVRVDGINSKEKGLKGKPDPDIFLEAARQLNVAPAEAIVVEDAQLGVEAAKNGEFGWIIGFSEEKDTSLIEHGADEVVDSLKKTTAKVGAHDANTLKSALELFEDIQGQINGKKPVFFFDFDGTLAPIVSDHTQAFMSDDMRQKLKSIAEQCLAGVVSGRGLDDVRERVGHIDGFYYVGSHGFEIAGPDDFYDQHEEAANQLSDLDKAQYELNEAFSGEGSIDVERKKFAIAVHYRNAPEAMVPEIEKHIDELSNKYSLRKGTGKKIFELKPDVDWHKGRAVRWLMEDLRVNDGDHVPIYLGDDITDEDAFEAIRQDGIGILVGEHDEATYARYRLESVEEVGAFLDKVIVELNQEVHG